MNWGSWDQKKFDKGLNKLMWIVGVTSVITITGLIALGYAIAKWLA